jgi:hypothetical protein
MDDMQGGDCISYLYEAEGQRQKVDESVVLEADNSDERGLGMKQNPIELGQSHYMVSMDSSHTIGGDSEKVMDSRTNVVVVLKAEDKAGRCLRQSQTRAGNVLGLGQHMEDQTII